MRVVVFSSTEFGKYCLINGVLPVDEAEVVGVLTTPQTIDTSFSEDPVEISMHASFQDVANANFDIHSLKGPIKKKDYLESLRSWKPDLILVLGWYYILPSAVRSKASKGCLGIHASLLPKYRGCAPIPWAIINGEKVTGVTLFHLEDQADSGDIVAQERFPITDNDTCATVYDKAMSHSAKVLCDTLPKLAAGTAPRQPQDESKATYYPPRSPEDGEIDWSWGAKRLRDFVRAQTKPYPGAFTHIQGKKIVIWDADFIEE